MTASHPKSFSQPVARSKALMLMAVISWAFLGCAKVTVEPIEVKPIHITLDITIRIDRQLDDFFNDVEKRSAQSAATAPSQP